MSNNKASQTKREVSVGGLKVKASGRDLAVTWNRTSSKSIKRHICEDNPSTSKKEAETKTFNAYSETTGYTVNWQESSDGGKHWGTSETKTVTGKTATTLTITADDDTNLVRVRVKPNPDTYTYAWYDWKYDSKSKKYSSVSKKTEKRNVFTGTYTAWKTLKVKDTAKQLDPPNEPSITVKGTNATLQVSYSGDGLYRIEFHWEMTGGVTGSHTVTPTASGTASYTVTNVPNGAQIRAYAVAVGTSGYIDSEAGDWSEWSDATTPGGPRNLKVTAGDVDNAAHLEWEAPEGGAEEYEIQYVSGSTAMFNSGEVQSATTSETDYYITGLDASKQWFFRIRSKNGSSASSWVYFGKAGTTVPGDDGSGGSDSAGGTTVDTDPTAPTTWQSDSIAAKGESVTLGWVHNCEDGCTAASSTVYVSVNGGAYQSQQVGAGVYRATLDTSAYGDGDTVSWYVTTTAPNGSTSPASTVRAFTVYVQPTVFASVPATVTALPVAITLSSGTNQRAVAFDVTVRAAEDYYATDSAGRDVLVASGAAVFSKHVSASSSTVTVEIGPGDALLASHASYTVDAAMATVVGLRAESIGAASFSTDFSEPDIAVGASAYAEDGYTARIVLDAYSTSSEDGATASGASLALYRREPDGSLTEIASGIPNSGAAEVADRHPSLGTCTYVASATDPQTGAVTFAEAEVAIECSGFVVQWDEGWADDGYTGGMLVLPYDMTVSETNGEADKVAKAYIGRKRPVSYYGTQLGDSATWGCDILKTDTDTLTALRNLKAWMGDVYVREPTGTGYWAQVSVDLSISADSATVPVTLSIVPVDKEA